MRPFELIIYAEVETIQALTRLRSGRLSAKQVRKAGRVPGILFSLPGEMQQLVTLDKKAADHLVGLYGRTGVTSRLFNLEVLDEDSRNKSLFPVLPKMVHRTAATGMVENITFLYCPPNRVVQVEVPIKVLGEDISPGMKKGGFVRIVRRSLRCRCLGNSIPPFIEADVSNLEVGEVVALEDVILPDGVLLDVSHTEDPICKIAGKASSS